ncbi:DUF5134 domain-containing protein [Frankia sp. B2]|uniref:DUF5134 domain-containing protein n=1 Tax=Frankia TaxID=1854 RepID=UPI000D58B740|nr:MULTISPECIES: DUF5134 domain-containing protein [Frankia]TFE33777.1 DUF5134 domain-containing protein [Frankia sp. B2]
MTHHHPAAAHALAPPQAVAVVAAAVCALLAMFHAGRLAGALARARRRAVYPPVEIGHTVVAAGMAVMFVGPRWMTSSVVFAVAYLALAGVFFLLVLTDPTCEPSRWSCCSMLVIEGLAMACMARAGRWPVDDSTGLTNLTDWFAVIFAAAVVAAVGGPLVRRVRPGWVTHPPPATSAASRLVMAGAMLLMLL